MCGSVLNNLVSFLLVRGDFDASIGQSQSELGMYPTNQFRLEEFHHRQGLEESCHNRLLLVVEF